MSSAPTLEEIITAVTALTDDGTLMRGKSVDVMWLLIAGSLVFFMQLGFALVEAGSVRAKNTKNILLKNILDCCIGALIWWSWGHALAYDPGDGFMGMTNMDGAHAPNFFLQASFATNGDSHGYNMAMWFFQFVFAAAAATIVSGAMAERTALPGYLVYTTVITGFIYPVIVHWVWSTDGWLSVFSQGYWETEGVNGTYGSMNFPLGGGVIDFAGSGVVHMTGGVAALFGAAIVGPRVGRFDEKKKPLPMAGHSSTLVVTGTFMLWLGWYGFNPGSTLGMAPAGYSAGASRAVVTTTISAAIAGLVVILLEKLLGDHTWSVGAACNGILAGLVSVTAGCASVTPGFAFLIGLMGGCFYFASKEIVLKCCKVDDPVDAVSVHGTCGAWGVLAAGLFSAPELDYRKCTPGQDERCLKGGLFIANRADGQSPNWNIMGAALAEVAVVFCWSGSISLIMFYLLKVTGMLRVSAEMEAAGMDVSKHGGAAYES